MFSEKKLDKPKFQLPYQSEKVTSQNKQITKDGRWNKDLNLQKQMKIGSKPTNLYEKSEFDTSQRLFY